MHAPIEAIRKSQVVGSPISWQLGATPFAHYTSRSRQELATFLYPAADLCNHDFENRYAKANIAERG
jgi:hypothetical protein